jgi:hypothetical protein
MEDAPRSPPPPPLGRLPQERNEAEDHVRSRSHFSSVPCTQCASGTKHETRQVQSPGRQTQATCAAAAASSAGSVAGALTA